MNICVNHANQCDISKISSSRKSESEFTHFILNLGQSKLFAPIWERIAKHFLGRPDLLLAKFDAINNDVEDEELSEEGFPALVMYHANTNQRVVYKGGGGHYVNFYTS